MLSKKNMNEKLKTSDGLDLFVKIWGQPEDSRACVLCVHGLGEHIERYEHVAQAMVDRKICMIGFDQRGHGQTPGKRGVIGSPERFTDDLREMLAYAQSLCPNKPIFIYGHSLGALEVLYFALSARPKIAGVIATSPPLDTATTSKGQRFLVGLLKKLLPNLTVPNQLDANFLSRDAQVVDAYIHDPLVHDQVSVALGGFLIDGAEYVLKNASEWQLPLYLAHGSADKICPIAGSQTFVQALRPEVPCTFKIWENAYHETHNEPDKDVAINAILNWIEDHLEE